MKAVWILSAVLVVLALNFEEATSQSKNCKVNRKIYQNGRSWLDNNCRRKRKCRNGGIRNSDYRCPSNSSCQRGKCACNANFQVKSRGSNGRIKSCKRQNQQSKNCQLKSGKKVQNGRSWLDNNCRRKRKCRNGGIRNSDYRCPSNSSCQRGKCACNANFQVKSRGSNGRIKSCKRQNQQSKNCQLKSGKKVQNGRSWLDNNCRRKRKCRNGGIRNSDYRCPSNSSCQRGKCACNANFQVKSRGSNGRIKSCKRQNQQSKNCQLKSGKKVQNGRSWLDNNCRRKRKCRNGGIRNSDYRCPSNSSCQRGKCACNANFQVKSRGSNGRIKSCKRQNQQSKNCKLKSGKKVQNGRSWLDNNCRRKRKCRNGGIRNSDYRCPSNSSCQRGKCVCNANFQVKSRGSNGRIKSCKRQNQQSKNCQLKSGKKVQNGRSWLDNNCRRKRKCRNGGIRNSDYRCPSNSSCQRGKCACNANFQVKSRGSNGRIKSCKRQNQQSKNCQLKSGKKVQNGRSWLDNNCRRKRKCRNGGIRNSDYRCPSNSSCQRGKCACNANFQVKSRGSNGRIKSCKRQNQQSKNCQLKSGKKVQNGRSWLDNNCRRKRKCRNGGIRNSDYRCPSNSSCQRGKCACNANFQVKSRGSNGRIKSCKRQNQQSKNCQLKSGKKVQNGRSWLDNNCRRKRKCRNGGIRNSDYRCPSNSSCQRGKCACNANFQVKSRGSNGRIKSCKRQNQQSKNCQLKSGKKVQNGRSWLDNNCRRKRKCRNGGIRNSDYRCPSNSSCQRGKCACNANFQVKSRGSNGRIKSCKRQNQQSKNCQLKSGKKVQNGRSWLDNNCRRKRKCRNGGIRNSDYRCPSNSSCQRGKCACNANFQVKSRGSNGRIKSCKRQNQQSKNCQLKSGKKVQNGRSWLDNNCRRKRKCRNGGIRNSDYRCPSNSSCQRGKCACNANFQVKSRGSNGRIKSCKRQNQQSKNCQLKSGKKVQNGRSWLDNNCRRKRKCRNGGIRNSDYRCPSNSSCQRGKCACNANFQVKSRGSNGRIKSCKRQNQQSKNCQLKSGKKVQNGRSWLDNNCRRKRKCRNGGIRNSDYRCPSNSSCQRGKCACNANFQVKSRGSNGRIKSCKRQNQQSKNCQLKSGKKVQNGVAWLTNGCKRKYKCRNGDIKRPQRYNCPRNTVCTNNQCHCKAKFQALSRTREGLLKSCTAVRDCGKAKNQWPHCPRSVLKSVVSVTNCVKPPFLVPFVRIVEFPLRNSGVIHGSKWLNGDCTRKFKCWNTKTRGTAFRCPAYSQCKFGGQCVCNYGYEVKSKDKNGILRRCKESEDLKCKGGFKRIFGNCLSIHRDANVKYVEAHRRCKAKGGRLLVTKNIYKLARKINKNKFFREGMYFLMGAPELSEKELKNYKNQAIKSFIIKMMRRYKCQPRQLYRTFKRFSGRAVVADWNYRSSVSSLCLAVTRNGPVFVRCSNRRGFICEQGNKEEKEAFWTKWYSTMTPNKKGERESLGRVLQKFNRRYTGKKADRLCRKPIAMECREVGTKKLYSKKQQHNLKLTHACSKNKIVCFKNKQRGKPCPNFEVRFKCLEDDSNDCSIGMVKRGCRNQGKKCVNRRTGAICVKQKKKRDKKDKADVSHCTVDSKKYEVHMCKATGDPHYTTLDGYKFNFMGTCSYEFAATCNSFVETETFPKFKIVSKNYKKKANVSPSWTKSFELTLGFDTYGFDQGIFTVNTNEITDVCGYSDKNINIGCKCKGKSATLIIKTSFCLQISWDNQHGLYVYIPDKYKKHICGLCGNFDGNPNNDLKKPNSKIRMSPSEIGRYYLEPGSDNDKCPKKIVTPPACSKQNVAKYSSAKQCGIFDVNGDSPIVKKVLDGSDSSVKNRNRKFLADEFTECVEDLCWDPTTKRCDDIEDVIDKLHKALNIIDADLDKKWRKYAGCENSGERRCSGKANMVYSSLYKPACQNTCAAPEQAFDCEDENEETGCICKEGFYLDAKRDCVAIEECAKSCLVQLDSGKFTLSDGKEYVAIQCKLILYCDKGVLKEKKLTPCSVHAECRNGRKCRCNEGYVGNGHECKTDLSCRRFYTAVGEKCYRFVAKGLDWNSAAINCGADGSVLARYDDLAGEELVTFFSKIPGFYLKSKAQRRKIYCRGKTNLPRNFNGLAIRLKSKRDKARCKGKFSLSKNGRYIKVTGNCKAWFVVKMIKASKKSLPPYFRTWIAGNAYVVSQKQRGDKPPFQIDPPRMLDLSVFKDANGCFQANLNKKGKLIVSPNPRCSHKKSSICEYDNIGKIPHNPLDFRRLKEKGNYEEAVEMCKKLGRPLVSIYNEMQNRKVRQMLKQLNGDGWIGAEYSKNKDKFVWSNNKPVIYINWKKREPNNYKNNIRSDEHCVAMDKSSGRWYTDDCTEPNYPICGPPFNMESASYSKYYKVNGFSSLDGLRKRLARRGKPDYVCEKPISIECSAREPNNGQWRNNHNQQGRALTCKVGNIRCRRGQGLDCRTFRVRFMCPSDENQCATLKSENINPCSGGRTCLPLRNHYRCKCTNGEMWDKHQQSCHKSCGTCSASGDPHYTSYFGHYYDFMGTCMYKFAGVCDLAEFKNSPHFNIYTKNQACGNGGASCIEYIEVHLNKIPYKKQGADVIGDFVFKVPFGTSKYMLNDREKDIGILSASGAFKVDRRRNFFNLRSDALALNVLFSGRKLSVNLPSKFIDKMCGLCGDCSSDKFRKKDLSLVSVPKSGRKLDRQAIIPVANEWIVPYDGSDEALCKVVTPIDECPADMKLKLSKNDMCGIFKNTAGPLAPCFDNIPGITYFEDCMTDACHANAMDSVCESVKGYAQKCMAQFDKILSWRTDDFCPMDCGEKMYRADASCEPTCGVDAAATCEEEPEEGCVCPSDLMRKGEECVKEVDCGCEVITGDEDTSVFIPLGESRLLPKCEEIAKCIPKKDGIPEVIRESVDKDVNAICVEDPDPRIDCDRGYILAADGRTCNRDPNACSAEYTDRQGMCIMSPPVDKVWRQAVHTCNKKDGTLVFVNTFEKLTELGKIMKENNFEQVFISGQVKAVVVNGEVTYTPVLSSATQSGKIEYYNFDFYRPPVVSINLPNELTPKYVEENDVILALVARRGDGDSVSISAVPRDTQTNFLCEERDVAPEDKVWHGPCNSDKNMADGDMETKEALDRLVDCHICPVPMEIRCTPVPNAVNTGTGECKILQSGTYYSCDVGDCRDTEVSTKCAKDVNECDVGLDDCPSSSSCQNTIGAYICKCNNDVPLMIRGYCQSQKSCGLKSPITVDDFGFEVQVFSGWSGVFSYNCPFTVFETCQEKFDTSSNMPYLRIYEFSDRQAGGPLVRGIGGVISNRESGVSKYFSIHPHSLATGDFMIGDSIADMDRRKLGTSIPSIKTSFTLIFPDIVVVHHYDNYFRFFVKLPEAFMLAVSTSYANMGCGICAMSPTGEEITFTKEQIEDLSGDYFTDVSACGEKEILLPTEPPTPTTTPMTFPEDVCDEDTEMFCNSLENLCSYSLELCKKHLCGTTQVLCSYLETAQVSSCLEGDGMDKFIEDLNCDAFCTGKDMSFGYTGGNPPERCQAIVDGNDETTVPTNSFACQCDDGYKFSGDKCVPKTECGCTHTDGIYLLKNDVVVNADCTLSFRCLGNNVIAESLLECSDNSTCFNSSRGHHCKCNDGYYGDAMKKDGCQPPVKEDETKKCYSTYNLEGMVTEKCLCKDGFVSQCKSCVDLDECAENEHQCDLAKEVCVNKVGSYECNCKDGFAEVAGVCTDIDECQQNTAKCGLNEGCVNTKGSYECQCCAGFKLRNGDQGCIKDPEGVEIRISQPKCCLQCDEPEKCKTATPEPYCFIETGKGKDFPSYKAAFEFICVNNEPKDKIQVGKCPKDIPLTTAGPGSGGNPTTEGSNPTTSGGALATTQEQGPDPTQPKQKTTTPKPTTLPPTPSCNSPGFCSMIPQPHPSLKNGPVCGPSNEPNKVTFPSYCAMAKSVCLSLGSFNNMPKVAISADSGPCPTTTTPPPPTTTQAPVPTQVMTTVKPVATESSVTSAPTSETTRAPAQTSSPPSDPLFTDWSSWGKCQGGNAALLCGLGTQRKTRQILDYDDDREVRPVKKDELFEERVCFRPCDPEDPNFTTDLCPEEGVCGEQDSPICGSTGPGGYQTYPNECEFNIKACKEGKVPTVLYDRECGEDGKPKHLCNGPRSVTKRFLTESDGITCVGKEIEINVCTNLSCKGGSENCCIPTDYEKIDSKIDCYNDEGFVQMSRKIVYLSAVGCKCSKDAEEEAGTDIQTP